MIKRALNNWKTTSMGLGAISGAMVHLWFNRKTINEEMVMFAVGQTLLGFGMIFAGDASKSEADVNEVKQSISNGTNFLPKPSEPQTPKQTNQ